MRTTIRMDDELIELAKEAALVSGRSFTRFVEDAVRSALAVQHAAERSDVDLPVFAGDGVLPGVELDSNAALLDVMEAEA